MLWGVNFKSLFLNNNKNQSNPVVRGVPNKPVLNDFSENVDFQYNKSAIIL